VRTSYLGSFEYRTSLGTERGTVDGGSDHRGSFIPRELLRGIEGVPIAPARTAGSRSALLATVCTPNVEPFGVSSQTDEVLQFRRADGGAVEALVPWPPQHGFRTCSGNRLFTSEVVTGFVGVGTLSEDFLLDGGVLTFEARLSAEQPGPNNGTLITDVLQRTTLEIIPAR
jgi:hypothetical protein